MVIFFFFNMITAHFVALWNHFTTLHFANAGPNELHTPCQKGLEQSVSTPPTEQTPQGIESSSNGGTAPVVPTAVEASAESELTTVENAGTSKLSIIRKTKEKSKEPPTMVEEVETRESEERTKEKETGGSGEKTKSVKKPAKKKRESVSTNSLAGLEETGKGSSEEQVSRRRRSGSSTGSVTSEAGEETRRKRKVIFPIVTHFE